MISIVPLNKINNTTEVINKSSIICNSHAQEVVSSEITSFFVFFIVLTIYNRCMNLSCPFG